MLIPQSGHEKLWLKFMGSPSMTSTTISPSASYGTNGKNIKVYYRGQRGEGTYDVEFEGLIKNVERRYRETSSDTMKAEYEEFMHITPCSKCKGQRRVQ